MKQPVLFGNGSPVGDWFQTIAVNAPLGASITVSGGGETLTATGTGSYYALDAHNKSTTYTITATIDGVSAPSQTVTTGTAAGVISFIDIAFGTINLTYANDFRGTTITCANGGTTISKTAPSGGNTMAFYPPNTGTWVISGEVGGTPYSTNAVVTSLSTPVSAELATVPVGSTVLPTDDIQIWLNCAGIYDKTSYTTLADVLADHDTLATLISNNNAVDYMVRSTTWATGVTADETAMRYIGKRNYAADTLLADSDWCEAIVDSSYVESVLNVVVPKATGASNDIIYSTQGSGAEAWHVFDRDGVNTLWVPISTDTYGIAYVGYNFNSNVKIKAVGLKPYYVSGVKIMGYDGSTWTELDAFSISGTSGGYIDYFKHKLLNNNLYSQYKVVITSSARTSPTTPNGCGFSIVQFYGRTDVVETNIDIYSAANDTVTITPQGGGASLTVVTDSAGHGTIAKSNLPAGTYTFASSVAKNPDNLSNYYSKTVTVDANKIEVFVMPDGALYWYGWKDRVESGTAANGWSFNSTYTLQELSYGINSVSFAPTSSNTMQALCSRKMYSSTKFKVLVESYSGVNVRLYASQEDKVLGANPPSEQYSVSSTGINVLNVTLSGAAYLFFRVVNSGQTATIKAMWYE